LVGSGKEKDKEKIYETQHFNQDEQAFYGTGIKIVSIKRPEMRSQSNLDSVDAMTLSPHESFNRNLSPITDHSKRGIFS